jgi:hypothetical protein
VVKLQQTPYRLQIATLQTNSISQAPIIKRSRTKFQPPGLPGKLRRRCNKEATTVIFTSHFRLFISILSISHYNPGIAGLPTWNGSGAAAATTDSSSTG